MAPNVIALDILALIGVVLVIAHLLLGYTHGYLLYSGFGFVMLGLSMVFTKDPFCLTLQLASILLFLLGLLESFNASKDRLVQFRAEQRDREEAFAEFLTAVTKKEALEERQQQEKAAGAQPVEETREQ